MRISPLLIVCVAGLLAAPAVADPAQPNQAPGAVAPAPTAPAPVATMQAPPSTTQASASDLDTIVCRTEAATTGTRLGGHRACKTQREWNQQQQEAQKNLEGMQTRGLTGAHPGGGG